MIRAFLGAIAVLLTAGAGAVRPAIPDRRGVAPLAVAGATAIPAASGTEGSNSTPGVFPLPQLGSAGFVCAPDLEVRPFFDLGSAIATEAVTIRAGARTRRNFSYEVVGRLHGRPVVEREFSRRANGRASELVAVPPTILRGSPVRRASTDALSRRQSALSAPVGAA